MGETLDDHHEPVVLQDWVGQVGWIKGEEWFDTRLVPFDREDRRDATKRFPVSAVGEQDVPLKVGTYFRWREWDVPEGGPHPRFMIELYPHPEHSGQLSPEGLEWAKRFVKPILEAPDITDDASGVDGALPEVAPPGSFPTASESETSTERYSAGGPPTDTYSAIVQQARER
ncbi:MAG TPA: hypothetical protein VMR18_03180 [Candidatus Saccharimonadales bacterium]|nr:hypothetical protein [Candidatus Saccharimonadales bacterium]